MSGPLLTVAGTVGSVADAEERDDALCVAASRDSLRRASPVRANAHTTVPSLLILGTDAVLAARPATPVQLAHACAAAGFDVVIPPSWGDEIIARNAVEGARTLARPVVQCSCPFVARKFADHADALRDALLQFVPPPVAAARYLRRLYGEARVTITYAGDCPIGELDVIDVHLSCDALFARFAERGVTVTMQPTEFDSVLPPDPRRHFSDPGGVPSENVLRRLEVEIVELTSDDLHMELAQRLIAQRREIVDLATALGCRCSGAIEGVPAAQARRRVRELEPPRSATPILDHDIDVAVDADQKAVAAHDDAYAVARPNQDDDGIDGEPALVAAEPVRRRSPPATRAVSGATTISRGERGRLPRAYVARRRSSPKSGLRQSAVRREAPSAQPSLVNTMPWIWIAAVAGVLTIVAAVLAFAR